jgi:hypothetical protein
MFKRKHREQGISAMAHPVFASVVGESNRTFRYERGGGVYATDGKIGTLRQVLVDEGAGVVLALVIDIDRTNVSILMPPEAVAKTAGSAVYLMGTCQQFIEWVPSAHRHNPKSVARARVRKLTRDRSGVSVDPRRMILRAGPAFIETGSSATDQHLAH